MFFSVSTSVDRRFPNNHQINNLWVNCDNGWTQNAQVFYKGYADNYCKITIDSDGAKIEHSIPRSFPLWYQEGIVTNIDSTLTTAWADDKIVMNSTGQIITDKMILDITVPESMLTTESAAQQLIACLDKSTRELIATNLKLFCSGGIDTFLLYGMLTKHNVNFDLVANEHYEKDTFTKTNQTALESFWAYKQIHHWTTNTWLATGSCGDEYFLRGPAVIAMLTAWHDIDFGKLLANGSTKYHYHHFNKYPKLWSDSWANRHSLREKYPTRALLNQQIINHLLNDHQHWHLGETITWTPFKNIELVKILLQCNIIDLLPQFLDGQINKCIIEYYSPHLLNFVSTYKNYKPKEKLTNFFSWHAQK